MSSTKPTSVEKPATHGVRPSVRRPVVIYESPSVRPSVRGRSWNPPDCEQFFFALALHQPFLYFMEEEDGGDSRQQRCSRRLWHTSAGRSRSRNNGSCGRGGYRGSDGDGGGGCDRVAANAGSSPQFLSKTYYGETTRPTE